MKFFGDAAKTSFFYKKDSRNFPYWKLIYKIKCQSTEIELSKYLRNYSDHKLNPIAIISREQVLGFGQKGRSWFSPRGGIWLSAAFPIYSNDFSPETFSLSIACQLCEILFEKNIKVKLKWPNDIFYESKKLIGFLPKLITRGDQILYARIGIGMNLNNKTPSEGISLSHIQNKKLCENFWTSELLKVICLAIESNSEKLEIIKKANLFLDKDYLAKEYKQEGWEIKEIDPNGSLRITKNKDMRLLKF